jgi:hypothetical protein
VAEVYRAAGEYHIRRSHGDKEKQASTAVKLLSDARGALVSAPPSAERNFLLIELAVTQADLGGDGADVTDGKRVKWDDVQKEIRPTVTALRPDLRMVALRNIARKLAPKQQGALPAKVAKTVFPPNEDFAAPAVGGEDDAPAPAAPAPNVRAGEPTRNYNYDEAIGQIGLELLRAKARDQAEAVAALADRTTPSGSPSLMALWIALAPADKPPSQLPSPNSPEKDVRYGYSEGWAQIGKLKEARDKAVSPAAPDIKLRALAGVVAARIDEALGDAVADLDVAAKIAESEMKTRKDADPAVLLRLAELAAKAGKPDLIGAFAAASPDPGMQSLIKLVAFQAKLDAAPKEKADDAEIKDIGDPKSFAYALAYERLARHNAANDRNFAKSVKQWDERVRPLGYAGVALGLLEQ